MAKMLERAENSPYFTYDSFAKITSAIPMQRRNDAAHLENTPLLLLSELLVLEGGCFGRSGEGGEEQWCLYLWIALKGLDELDRMVGEIRGDGGQSYPSIDETQWSRLRTNGPPAVQNSE